MKTIEEKILDIYRSVQSCHPSREDNIKSMLAIKLLAKELDELKFEVKGLHEWKIEKEGI